jgi:hypothetical protein
MPSPNTLAALSIKFLLRPESFSYFRFCITNYTISHSSVRAVITAGFIACRYYSKKAFPEGTSSGKASKTIKKCGRRDLNIGEKRLQTA